MKPSQLDAMLADSGFDPDDVEHLAAVLSPLAELPAEVPAPSAELLALFGEAGAAGGDGRTATVVPLARGRRSMVAGALVLALSGVGATGLSAAANTLPSPLQHQVSDFSRRYLPFDFPEPTVQVPHLAGVPSAEDSLSASAAVDPQVRAELLRNAGEISRSLTSARPGAKAVPAWTARRGDRVVPADTATHTPSRTSWPSATSSASSSPSPGSSTKPNGIRGSGPTYAPASPAKTASSHPSGGKPGTGGAPPAGGNPVRGGPATDPGKGQAPGPVQEPQVPDPTVLIPELPEVGIPVEGGPVLDRVTPDAESDTSDN